MREEVSAMREGLQPFRQVYTARYLSRVCLKKCIVAEKRIPNYRASSVASGNTLKSVLLGSLIQ